MMPTAFVATDPDTGRRIGVAWNELDASEMMTRADAILGRYMAARIERVETSRTPAQMREARRGRERAERHAAEAARVEAQMRPPEGYALRRSAPLAASTLRREWGQGWAYALAEIASADGWTEWGYGHVDAPVQNALAARGMILVATPLKGRGRYLFRATDKGLRYLKKHGLDVTLVPIARQRLREEHRRAAMAGGDSR